MENNQWVYRLFEVSNTASWGVDWLTAVKGCENWSENGGGWRLPTHKELMLMLILRSELEQFGITDWLHYNSFSNYWSATETSATHSLVIEFKYLSMYAVSKDISNLSRQSIELWLPLHTRYQIRTIYDEYLEFW